MIHAPFQRPVPPATNLPYRLRTLGRIHHDRYHSTLGTYHHDAMLMVILGGRGSYRLAQQVTLVETGMIGLVLPGGDPGLLMADPADPYDHLYCRFGGAEALRVARRIAGHMGHDRFVRWPQWQGLGQVLLRGVELGLRPMTAADQADELARADGVLVEALAVLSSSPDRHELRLTAERLRAYLHEHITTPMDLALVADAFGVSREHLSRTAKKLLGHTLHDYWLALRVAWAQRLLREPELSVAEIARRVGFDDPFHFSKAFKRVVGVSPAIWRKQAKA